MCIVEGCESPIKARERCARHYSIAMRTGEIEKIPRLDPMERFMRSYAEDGMGCWIWHGPIERGYGVFWVGRRKFQAQRWAYEKLIGPIPGGLVLDHIVCSRGAEGCVNPYHCKPVTRSDNSARNAQAAQTHCKNGHEFTPENTYSRPGGGRVCKICRRKSIEKWDKNNRETINAARQRRRAAGSGE